MGYGNEEDLKKTLDWLITTKITPKEKEKLEEFEPGWRWIFVPGTSLILWRKAFADTRHLLTKRIREVIEAKSGQPIITSSWCPKSETSLDKEDLFKLAQITELDKTHNVTRLHNKEEIWRVILKVVERGRKKRSKSKKRPRKPHFLFFKFDIF